MKNGGRPRRGCYRLSRRVAGSMIVLLLLFLLLILLLTQRAYLLGDGPTLQGGLLGRKVDNTLKSWVYLWRHSVYQREFQATMGYALPQMLEKQTGVPVLPHAYLVHALQRAQKRHQLQQQLLQDPLFCQLQHHRCIFVPLFGSWYNGTIMNPPTVGPGGSDGGKKPTVIYFQESELEEWVYHRFGKDGVPNTEIVWDYYNSKLSSRYDKVQWACLWLTLLHGGSFVASHFVRQEIDTVASSVFNDNVIVLEAGATANIMKIHISHPLPCMVEIWTSLILSDQTVATRVVDWKDLMGTLRQACTGVTTCCSKLQWLTAPPMTEIHSLTTVTISSSNAAADSPMQLNHKHSKQTELEDQNCRAGWLCHRCLRLPWRGSLAACQDWCFSCYERIVGGSTYATMAHDVRMYVHVNRTIMTTSTTPAPNQHSSRIPRIIHQTWFEPLTTAQYPHLIRLQNSWKAVVGWEYRFYTDDSARNYIQTHFPSRFVDAYDALLPGAFKADLFRLLLLLREGGVYSDIDVQLDTDLNSFLEAGITFFVPRDCPLDRWPDSNYCLWNGLMGSTPGHPILIQAVEDIMNTVLNRLDYYDLEGVALHDDTSTSLWKLRSIPILILTGPCALGMSLNKAYNRTDRLRGFPIGWLVEADGVLLLQTDRYDSGELRFTDIDRNLLVASTNADAFAKKAVSFGQTFAKGSVHYSQSESEVMGAHGVYKADDSTAGERIVLERILG